MRLNKLVKLGQEGMQINLDFIFLILESEKEYKWIYFLKNIVRQCGGLNPAY